jgi:hypothetical protein
LRRSFRCGSTQLTSVKLAQSQDAGTAQSQSPGSSPQASGPADYQINTPVVVMGTYMDAPSSAPPTFTGINLSPYFASPQFTQYDPGRAFLQTLGVGIGGTAVVAGGMALAPAIRGPALGALMELSGSSINTNAAQNVLTVIASEGYAEFLETMNTLGEALKSLEVEEATGPEIPWE